MATFKLRDVFPIIEQIIAKLCKSQGIALRDEIAAQLLQDVDGRVLVTKAYEANQTGQTEREISGNMVDWFSAKFESDDPLTVSAKARYERRKHKGKWAYFIKGHPPADVTFETLVSRTVDETKKEKQADRSRPTVFISYSHDSDTHKDWVRRLAGNLEENGVATILDQWDLNPGADATAFMERGVRNADFVLVICTSNYITKADGGQGGAGYEKMIASAELVQDQGSEKFIPLVLETTRQKTPTYLSGRIYVDFCDANRYADSLDVLIRQIHNVPRHRRPESGTSPYGPDGSGSARVRF